MDVMEFYALFVELNFAGQQKVFAGVQVEKVIGKGAAVNVW